MLNKKNKSLVIFLLLIYLALNNNQIYGQSKFSIHGHMTQAFAIAQEHVIHGIPTEGSFDYRNLALQFRYDLNEKNIFIVQLSHRRLGASPLMAKEKDVKLDWAFFEYRFNDNVSIKVGKVLIPLGIYNEIRDVGVLLPMYRAPFYPYGESNFVSKSVNGALLTFSFSKLAPWILKFDVYGGQHELIEWYILDNPLGGDPLTLLEPAYHTNIFGSQLWLNTPIKGIRLGSAFLHGKANGGVFFSENGLLGERIYNGIQFSFDGSFGAGYLRSEYAHIFLSKDNGALVFANFQAGLNLSDKITLHSQFEQFQVKNVMVPINFIPQSNGIRVFKKKLFQDYGIGISYAFNSFLVFKLETHWSNSYLIEDLPTDPFRPEGYGLQYSIISVSTSF